MLFYPTAIGWHPSEKAEFGEAQSRRVGDDAAQPRDRERRLRCGRQPRRPREAGRVGGDGIEFWGGSFVSDPFGVVLAEASRTEEEILIVPCDRRHQENVRRHWPFLRDRRIDAYAPIAKRFIDPTD